MPISVISVKCPDCGKTCNLEELRPKAFCSYCGAQILINNENEYTVRYIDEADIKRAETEQMAKKHEIKMAEKRKVNKNTPGIAMGLVSIALIAIGVWGLATDRIGLMLCIFIGFILGIIACGVLAESMDEEQKKARGEEQDDNDTEDIIISETMEEYRDKNFQTVETLLEEAGFYDIVTVPLYDLSFSGRKSDGNVEKVTINGKTDYSEGDVFPDSAKVIIMYHSRKK